MYIEQLKLRLQQSLPGLPFQFLMAPPVRHKELVIRNDYKVGAVAILLFLNEGKWSFLLMQRTEDTGVHSGQISLPGGKYDITDYTTTYTAMRELEEEMGISIFNYTYLGALTPLYIPPSNFMVYPSLFITEQPIEISSSPSEVVESIIVSLNDLLDEGCKGSMHIGQSDNRNLIMEVPIYRFNQKHKVWGATAMILSELENIIKSVV